MKLGEKEGTSQILASLLFYIICPYLFIYLNKWFVELKDLNLTLTESKFYTKTNY